MTDHIQKKSWGVLFDMDGVLMDSYQAHFLSWKRMLANHGLRLTEKEFASSFGWTNADIFSQCFPSINPDDYTRLGNEKESAFREIIRSNFPEMDGASDLISALKRAGALQAIGSSAPSENVKAFLEIFTGGTHFAATIDADEIKHGKPDPEVFLKLAEKINLSPEECVVVEDAPAGVEAGKRAGCAVIAITGTATSRELQSADLIVNSLRELTPDIFKELIKSNPKNMGKGLLL